MKKLSKKETNMLIALAGLLIAVAAYYFGYQKLTDKADELSAQSAAMETQIATYETWLANQDVYEEETARMKQEITDWVGEFPSNALPEDDMKLVYQLDNRSAEDYLFVESMAFGTAASAYTTDYTTDTSSLPTEDAELAQAANLYPVYTLYQTQTSLGMTCSYSGLKKLISNVYSQSDRRAVDAVSLSFDDATGLLNGSLTLDTYYVTGSDKPYSQPSLTPVREGTDNIFGTVEAADVGETAETEESATQ